MVGRQPSRRRRRGGAVEPVAPAASALRDVQSYLAEFVDTLKESRILRDPAVERAFRRVPRHLFVDRFFIGNETEGWTLVEHDFERPQPEQLKTIYSGSVLITRLEGNLGTSSSSQPALMVDMLQLLDVRPGMRVLEIGAGTGYNAALLADLAGDASLVTTIDIQPDVVEQTRRSLARAGYGSVRVVCRDGFEGAPEAAPFDRIVATVGCPDVSPQWAEQLAPEGFMLIPLRHAQANPLVRAWRDQKSGDAGLEGAVVSVSGFMAIQGALCDPSYYDVMPSPLPAEEGETERPIWPNLKRLDFWFYLGVCEPRTRLFGWLRTFGLRDEPTGRTARIERDRLVGDPVLLDQLDACYRQWLALGAPEMRRWRLRFVPLTSDSLSANRQDQAGRNAAEGAWTQPGTYYRRLFTLAPRP